ncbi:MAG: penicillin-binding protein activator LpoB [Marinifilaceae bacterium]
MKKLSYFLITILAACLLTGCGSRKVTRVNTNTTIDLSGAWNDSDSRMVSAELANDIVSSKWIPIYEKSHDNKRPVVVVGAILNKTHEHINTETFIKDIERAMINSGSVRVVQAGAQREELRVERKDQQSGFVSPETMKKWGRELGADFMLQGTVNSIIDSYKKNKVVYYQVDLQLSNIETNEVVWMGSQKIKKQVSDRAF